MRVAIFTDNDFDKVNGVTTTLRAVLAHLPADIEARVYTAADVAADTADYVALRAWGIGMPLYREMRMFWPRPCDLRRRIVADRIDAVHLTTPGPVGLAGRWIATSLGLPVVGSYHTRLGDYIEVLSGSPRLGRWFEAYMRWFYGSSRVLFAPTAAMANRLADRGYHAERLAVWSRGIDTVRFAPSQRSQALREAWHVSDRRPALLYAGRLSREKGLGRLAAIGRQLDRARAAHRLIVVGDGPMKRELAAACPDAVMTGTLVSGEVAVAMASADAFIFPSETDTLGNVVLEAQASGLPVIVADRDGPGENIVPAVTGFVGDDDSALAARAADLLTRPDLRARMGAAAREYALTRQWPAALAPLHGAWRAAVAAPAASVANAVALYAPPVRRTP